VVAGRFRDDRATVSDFGRSILVRCPRCQKRASVTGEERRMTCGSCGLARRYDNEPLWLSVECCGHWLVANNADHLQWLENFIGAKIRERPADTAELGWSNRSMASRLPQWMRSAKNRAEILKGLAQLRSKLEE